MTDHAARSPLDWPAPLRYAILVVVAAFVLLPLVVTVIGGLKELGELRTNPFGLPASWQWENYWAILSGGRYWRMLGNSFVIAIATVVLTVACSAMAAFVFAQVKFFGSEFLLAYLTLGLMFPAATAVLPLFIKVRDLGLLDTYWAVILPQTAFGLAMSILLCRNFFKGLPEDLRDASFIDGTGYFGFFWHIVLPLCGRSSPPPASSPSSTAGTPSSFRWWCSTAPNSIPGRWASWSTRASTRPIGTSFLPTSRSPCCR